MAATVHRADATGQVLDALRPEPHRGDTVAAGVVALTVAIGLLEVRFDSVWSSGVHLVITGLPFVAVAIMAVTAPLEGERPRAYQSVLYVATFALAFAFLANLADVLGADDGLSASGTLVWVGLLLGTGAAWLAVRRNSAIMTLVAAVTYGVVVLAFVDWVFDPDGVATFRWILLLLIAGYVFASVSQRGARPRHGVQMVNAAGLAAVALGATFVFELIFGAVASAFGGDALGHGAGAGWELVLLACGFGLVAYAAADREAGPAYLGVIVLLMFTGIAGAPGSDGASLIGWPILVLIAAGALLAAGLRPSRPLPPAPDAGGPPPPPPATMPARPLPPDDPGDPPTEPTQPLP